jgi:hypothetical protein
MTKDACGVFRTTPREAEGRAPDQGPTVREARSVFFIDVFAPPSRRFAALGRAKTSVYM